MPPTPKNRRGLPRTFSERASPSERGDPEYLDHRLAIMVGELLSLSPEHQSEYYRGLTPGDRTEILEQLTTYPRATAIATFLDEAQRCLTRAAAPNGAACVAGKALDLLLHMLSFDLKGTLGRKLHDLRRIAANQTSRLHATNSERLVSELLMMWDHIETRNSAAHYDTQKPEVSISAAEEFIRKVTELYKLEIIRQNGVARRLQAEFYARKHRVGIKRPRQHIQSTAAVARLDLQMAEAPTVRRS
jgi:hypothetical protein